MIFLPWALCNLCVWGGVPVASWHMHWGAKDDPKLA